MRRLHLLKNRFARRSPKIPLRLILLVPYVLLAVGTVGLVEYLCLRNQQQVVQDLAEQLTIGVSDRVNYYLEGYLATPQLLDRLNASAIRLAHVDVSNPKSLERHFLQQISAFDSVSRIRFSNPQGGLIAVGNDGGFTVASTDGFVKGTLRVYGINSQGHRTKLLVEQQNYHASQRPFHQIALKAGKPTWTQIYIGDPAAKGLGMTASYPLYDAAHRFQGVFSTDLMLAEIDKFLARLKIGSGTVFVMERSGLLVASATGEPAISVDGRQTRRLAATASQQIQIRQTAEQLFSQFGSLTKIHTVKQLHFDVEGKRQFLRVSPLRDRFGLDWLVVVTVPEADFMERIAANIRTTILSIAGVLAGAIVLGWPIAYCITRTIRQLSQASRALARGEWQQAQEDSAIAELEVLARAFNHMAAQLQRSFKRVNTALQESQEKFATIFRNSPDAICLIALPQECYLEVNDRFLELTGYSRQEIVGRPVFEVNPFGNPILVGWLRHPIEMQQTIRNLEFDFCSKSGQTRTALLSIEVVKLEGQRCLLFLFKDITARKSLEIALQHSNVKLNQILNTAIAAICCLRAYADYTWEYDFWSKGCEAVFGYTAAEFMADRHLWAARVLPEDMENILMPKFESLLAEQSITCEYRFLHKDGTLRWISGTCSSQRDVALDCWIVTTVAMDITARKQAETALQQSERLSRSVFDTSAVSMGIISLEGKVLQANPALCQMLGYTETELLELNFQQIVYPEDREINLESARQALAGEISYYHLENRYLHQDKRIIWALLSISLVRDSQQQPLYFVALLQDITARKQAEAALRDSEERFREAFANAPIGMALVSLNGNFLKVNRSLCKIVGYSEAELLALSDREITHPDDLKTLEAIGQMLAGEIRFHQIEKRYLHKQGNPIQILWSVSLASDRDNQPLYFISQVQDITERQAIDRMKNELISIVSHELRTPLTAICGSLGLVVTGIYDRKPEKAKRMIEMALIDSERLTRLVNQILDLERLDSGSTQMVMEACAAENLMQQAVETIQAIAAQHAIFLSVTPTSARVWATPDYILQVLTNLLDNAIKFSPPGSTVWLSAEVVSPEWCQLKAKRQLSQAEAVSVVAYVSFQVKDRGRGIPADKLESIFGRFQQVDVSDSRQKGGTGLGLAICKRIVHQHGGSIWVESVVGEGSTFYFTLPAPN